MKNEMWKSDVKNTMTDFSALISSVVKLLSDPSADVVRYASDALIEMGKPAATKVCRIIIQNLNIFSSSLPVNRAEMLKCIREITKFSAESDLIRNVSPPIIQLLIASPQIDGEISEICQDILCNFADRSAQSVLNEIHDINVTLPLSEFLLKRARAGEMSFFLNNNQPTNLFIQLCQKSAKVTDEATRESICNLFTQISVNLTPTVQYTTGNCISIYVGEVLEQMASMWYKSSTNEIQKHILSTVGSCAIIAGEAEVKKRADKFLNMFTDAISSKNMRLHATGAVSTFMSTLEKARELPPVQTQQLSKYLFELINSEFQNMQTDGLIMKSLNEAVGALSTIQLLYPGYALETTLSKLPHQSAFFILNYFCSSLSTTPYAGKLVDAIASVKFVGLKPDQKEMYCNCFCTLIRKCDDKIPKLNDVLKNVIYFISNDQQNARGTILALIATARQSVSSYKILYPVIFNYINDPIYFFSSPTLIEIASIHISTIKNHEEGLESIKIKPIQLIALLMSFYYSELMSVETKTHIQQLILSLTQSNVTRVDELTDIVLNQNQSQDYHFDLLSFAQKYFEGYIHHGGDKPILPANIRSALRGGYAIFCGHLMKSEYCRTKADSILTLIMSKFERSDLTEVSAIAEFIGLSSIYLPDFAYKFTKTQTDILVANADNKYKFWVKKNETGLPVSGVVLCVAELLTKAPQSMNLDNITFTAEQRFISLDSLPRLAKLRFFASALTRVLLYNNVKIDSRKFANWVLGGLKDSDVAIVVASVAGIASAFCIDDKLIGDFSIVSEILAQIKGNWKSTDIANVIMQTAKIAAASSKKDNSVMMKYHDMMTKHIFGDLQDSVLQAVNKVVDNIGDVGNKNLTKLAAFYGIVYMTTINEFAKSISTKLLNKLSGFDAGEVNAETLSDNLLVSDIPSVFEALGQFGSNCPFQYQSTACDVLKVMSKNEKLLASIEEAAKYYAICFSSGMDVKDAFVPLINTNAELTVDTALSVPYSRRLSNLFNGFITRRDLARTVTQVLINGMLEGEQKGEVSFRIVYDSAESNDLRFEVERERGIFATLVMKNKLLASTPKASDMARKIVLTEVTPKGDTDFDSFVAFLEKPRVDRTTLLNLATQDRLYDKEFTIVACSCLSALLQYEDTCAQAIDGIAKIVETHNKDIIQAAVDAFINLQKASSSLRAAHFERVIKLSLSVKDECDISQLLLAASESMSEEQLKNVGVDILKYVKGMLCTHSQMDTQLKIIYSLSLTGALMCEKEALDMLAIMYPLCLVHIYATGKDVAIKAVDQIARKLGYAEPSLSSMSITEFADSFAQASVEDSKAPKEAAQALIEAATSSDSRLKSVALYFAAAANAAGAAEAVNSASVDESPDVRVAALKAIVALESKKN